MSHHKIELWTFYITTIGVVVGVLAVVAAFVTILVALKQARDTAKTAQAQFWMMVRGILLPYDDIHSNLRPGGDWFGSSNLPATPEDMGRTEVYMGILEYCDTLLEEGLIDKKAFANSYRYRLCNIVASRWVIDQKLVARGDIGRRS